MVNLSTKYMGLELKNPIIIGACNLTNDLDFAPRLEDSGAAAIVCKSLFEEQIQLENLQIHEEMSEYANRNAEMITLFPEMEHAGPQEFLINLAKLKKSVNIPVIASLNAVYKETWLEYSKLIEETKVDALELNFFTVPDKFDKDAETISNQEIEIFKEIKKQLKIPVSIKMSPYYANPLNIISRFDKEGVDGFVLFNKFLQPDIDIQKEEHHLPHMLSSQEDNKLPLRYAGLLFENIHGSVCCNSGIHTAEDVIKMILGGADCVQVVSTIYMNKPEYLQIMLAEIEKWMESKGYNKLSDFKGKLSKKALKDRFVYKRAQYIDILLQNAEIFKKNLTR